MKLIDCHQNQNQLKWPEPSHVVTEIQPTKLTQSTHELVG